VELRQVVGECVACLGFARVDTAANEGVDGARGVVVGVDGGVWGEADVGVSDGRAGGFWCCRYE